MGNINQTNSIMSYKEGIILAITELKDRTGSSMIAIKKHGQGNLPSDKKWINGTFLKVLKAGVASGDFVQIKNSYKLSPDFKKKLNKKTPAAPAKKTAAKKKAPAKKASGKATTKKAKSAPKKAAAAKKKSTTTKKKTTTAAAAKNKSTTTKKKKTSKK